MRRQLLSRAGVITLTAGEMAPLPAAVQASSSVQYSPLPGLVPQVIVEPVASHSATQRPTGAFRLKMFLIACCRRPDIRKQCDFVPQHARGRRQQGADVVIFDSFGSPAIRQNLETSPPLARRS